MELGSQKLKFGVWEAGLVLAMLCLIGLGLASIYSATASQQTSYLAHNFMRQIYWAILGTILFLVTISLHPKFFEATAYLFYGLVLVALLAVLFVGRSGGGAARWLAIGGFRVQPSEWAKLATILALARFLADHHDAVNERKNLLIAAALGLMPMLLIFKQPDLGTSLVFIAIVPAMMFWAGVSPLILFLTFLPGITALASFQVWSFFLVMLILAVVLFLSQKGLLFSLLHAGLNILVGIVTPSLWNSLEPYQQKRVLAFVGLVKDPRGINYQVIQSKVAIGSGGLVGKGFLHGTQTQLRFLPEQHTDFIFSVIGEEFGFIGGLVVVALFVFLLIRGVQIAASTKHRFYSLASIGIVSLFFYHYFVNLGMVMGIMPVTGLPLPFISYGGSFLLTSMIGVGLLVNFAMHRQEY
ncbi:MAG TPA: rod shape-determining protein RodA [Bacteroidetes bacterium]|nr:rod shape-determining protein RodA [Bacteroidota bacterium]